MTVNDVKEQIKNDYLSGIMPKELAEKYSTSLNTIKSWIKRYSWSKLKIEGAPSKEEGAPSNIIQSAPRKRINRQDNYESVATAVEHVIENADLSDKQRLFCLLYIRCFNATKAYQKAYECGYETAMVNGSDLLRNTKVKEEILRLKQNRLNREMLDEADVFQWYLDIARADIRDYVEFGNEEISVVDKQGREHRVKVSNVNIKNDSEVDGILISEISKGKDGVKVKLPDKLKAMEWIADHMDLATEKQRAEIAVLRAKGKDNGQVSAEDKVKKLFEAIGGALDDEAGSE